MRKLFFIICLVFINCNESSVKRYEDYNEEDFIEVQGIVMRTVKKNNFQNFIETDIHYIYNLGHEKPTVGKELKSDYMPHEGEPAIILVHKEDKNITFYGYSGILDEGEDVLLEYLKKCEEIGGGYYGVDDW